jgi:hypothetical protein
VKVKTKKYVWQAQDYDSDVDFMMTKHARFSDLTQKNPWLLDIDSDTADAYVASVIANPANEGAITKQLYDTMRQSGVIRDPVTSDGKNNTRPPQRKLGYFEEGGGGVPMMGADAIIGGGKLAKQVPAVIGGIAKGGADVLTGIEMGYRTAADRAFPQLTKPEAAVTTGIDQFARYPLGKTWATTPVQSQILDGRGQAVPFRLPPLSR